MTIKRALSAAALAAGLGMSVVMLDAWTRQLRSDGTDSAGPYRTRLLARHRVGPKRLCGQAPQPTGGGQTPKPTGRSQQNCSANHCSEDHRAANHRAADHSSGPPRRRRLAAAAPPDHHGAEHADDHHRGLAQTTTPSGTTTTPVGATTTSAARTTNSSGQSTTAPAGQSSTSATPAPGITNVLNAPATQPPHPPYIPRGSPERPSGPVRRPGGHACRHPLSWPRRTAGAAAAGLLRNNGQAPGQAPPNWQGPPPAGGWNGPPPAGGWNRPREGPPVRDVGYARNDSASSSTRTSPSYRSSTGCTEVGATGSWASGSPCTSHAPPRSTPGLAEQRPRVRKNPLP